MGLQTPIRISRQVSLIQGTSANLIEGDTLTIRDLLFGMMLPSGNDAAVALGVHFGGILKHAGTKDPEVIITPDAVERRLRAVKIVAARNHLEQLERRMRAEQEELNQEPQEETCSRRIESGSMTCKPLFSGFKQRSGHQLLK